MLNGNPDTLFQNLISQSLSYLTAILLFQTAQDKILMVMADKW